MSEEAYNLQRLLVLRKLTRSVSEFLGGQFRDCLATVAPLLRPKSVFGDYVQGAAKEPSRVQPDKAFRDLQGLYQAVSSAKPFGLVRELTPPLDVSTAAPELVPVEYLHEAKSGGTSKPIQVTAPLQWILVYPGVTPAKIRELLSMRSPDPLEVQRQILHFCVMNIIVARNPGVVRLLEAVRYPVSTVRMPEFGELPFTRISAPVSTVRPPDDLIIDSTELSGKNVFEEVIDLESVRAMRDPVKAQLLEMAGEGENAAAGR